MVDIFVLRKVKFTRLKIKINFFIFILHTIFKIKNINGKEVLEKVYDCGQIKGI